MMKRMSAAAGCAAVLLMVAAPVAAQYCAGYPSARGQTSVGLRASFPTEGTSVGIEASRNWNNPLAVFANFNLLFTDDEDQDNTPIFGVGLAYEVSDFIPAVPAWLSICPVGAVTFASANEVTQLTVPLGIGFGTTIGVEGAGMTVHPFLIPQFVLTRVSIDDVSVSDNNFGFGGGALVKFGGVYAGVTAGKVFVEGADVDLDFRLGLTFPAPR